MSAHLYLTVSIGNCAVFLWPSGCGNTTSAWNAVSVRKISCTTSVSSLARASRACWAYGHTGNLQHPVRSAGEFVRALIGKIQRNSNTNTACFEIGIFLSLFNLNPFGKEIVWAQKSFPRGPEIVFRPTISRVQLDLF